MADVFLSMMKEAKSGEATPVRSPYELVGVLHAALGILSQGAVAYEEAAQPESSESREELANYLVGACVEIAVACWRGSEALIPGGDSPAKSSL